MHDWLDKTLAILFCIPQQCGKQTEITSTADIIIIISISLKLRGTENCVGFIYSVLKILMHYHFPIYLQAGQHYLIAYFLIN